MSELGGLSLESGLGERLRWCQSLQDRRPTAHQSRPAALAEPKVSLAARCRAAGREGCAIGKGEWRLAGLRRAVEAPCRRGAATTARQLGKLGADFAILNCFRPNRLGEWIRAGDGGSAIARRIGKDELGNWSGRNDPDGVEFGYRLPPGVLLRTRDSGSGPVITKGSQAQGVNRCDRD